VTSVEPDSDLEWDRRIGAGNIDAQGKAKMPEDHSLTVNYELERFPDDGSGNPHDPFGDASVRTGDNELTNTHTFLSVQEQQSIIANNTLHSRLITNGGFSHPSGSDPGATAKPSRSYMYGYGGRGEEASLNVDPSDSGVVTVEMPYQFEKLRPYQIDQMSADTEIGIVSSVASDTNIDVTIEDVGANQSEVITTDGSDATTFAVSSAVFPDVRCASTRQQEHEGAILVFEADTSTTPATADELLTIIPGSNQYDEIESDEGIPPLNAGSFDDGSSLEGPQYSLGSDIDWQGGRVGDRVQSTNLSVSNEIESTETQQNISSAKSVNGREITAESTVFGQTESHEKLSKRIQGEEGPLIIYLTDGQIKLPNAYISDGGLPSREEEQAQMNVDVTFQALQADDGSPAIQFTHA
jgi:hypothetical protein